MAVNKGAAAGKAFLAGVLAKLPEAMRGKASELFESTELQTYVGDGTLALEDFTRQSDALRTQNEELATRATELDQREQGLSNWHANLTKWYGDNRTLLERVKQGNGNGNGNPNPNPTPTNPTPAPQADALTEQQYNERIGVERQAFLGFQRDQNQITRDHFAKFQEIVDLEPLLAHPQVANIGLTGVYNLVHKDRLDKWTADTTAAQNKKIADEAVRKYQETQAQMPYPTPTGVGTGSPLDAIKPSASDSLVDAATAEYNRLQAERHAGAGAR